MIRLAAAETEQIGNTWLNLAIFGAFVAVTMVFVIRASRTNKSAAATSPRTIPRTARQPHASSIRRG